MMEEGKLELLLEELERHNMNIVGLSETRWEKVKDKDGVFEKGSHTIFFSGNEKGGEHGVAIVLDKHYAASLVSHNSLSNRIVTAKLNAKPVPLKIVQVYAPTADYCEEEVAEKFYNELQ